MKDYWNFVSVAVLLLILLAAGITARVHNISEGTDIILAALAGDGLLVKAWIDKAKRPPNDKNPSSSKFPAE